VCCCLYEGPDEGDSEQVVPLLRGGTSLDLWSSFSGEGPLDRLVYVSYDIIICATEESNLC